MPVKSSKQAHPMFLLLVVPHTCSVPPLSGGGKNSPVDGCSPGAIVLIYIQWIGAFAAALGGVDTLVFADGIGENGPVVRARICNGLGFLGIELEEKRNLASAAVISTEAGRVAVGVMNTDEEWMIAKTVCRVLGLGLAIEKRNSERNPPQGEAPSDGVI